LIEAPLPFLPSLEDNPMLIIAFDAATRCGVAEGIAGGTPSLQTVNFGGRTFDEPEDVFARASTFVNRRLDLAPTPDVVAIEVPVPKYDSLVVLGLYAIICGAARQRGIPIKRAAVATWRAYALGTSKLQRPAAKARALATARALGWKPIDDNAAEAGLIWLWACSVVAPRQAQRPEPLFLGAAKK
jgi:hypothetical protein